MSRHEADREDLLREATALVERVELTLSIGSESLVAGFRRDGSASFFFGGDPVYQFNSAGELRRAYFSGRLIKAEGSHLVSLDRQRNAQQVELIRHELDESETAKLLADVTSRLDELGAAIASGACTIVGQVPLDKDVMQRLVEWLAGKFSPLRIASTPHAR